MPAQIICDKCTGNTFKVIYDMDTYASRSMLILECISESCRFRRGYIPTIIDGKPRLISQTVSQLPNRMPKLK